MLKNGIERSSNRGDRQRSRLRRAVLEKGFLPLLLAMATAAQAGVVDVTVVSGQDGQVMPWTIVGVFEQAGEDWLQVGQHRTDREGQVSLDLPFEQGEVYELRARSRFDMKGKNSEPIAGPGPVTFVVGGAAVTLQLWNEGSGSGVADAQVIAQRRLPDGTYEQYTSQFTNADGIALFDLPRVDEGEIYVFAASPYFLRSLAEVVSDPVQGGGDLTLAVGTSTLTVTNAESGQPITNAQVRVYEVGGDGRPVPVAGFDGVTDASGRVYYDLPALADGRRFRFRVFDPLGDRTHHFTDTITEPAPVALAVAPRTPAPVIDQRLAQAVNRLTYGATPELLEHVQAVGFDVFLEEQLYPEAIDDAEFDALVAGWEPGPLYVDLNYYMLFHAILSKRQLLEVMTAFWNNHFNTDNNKVAVASTLNGEEHIAFREAALTSFRQLLGVSAHSPAMITYLDTQFSRKDSPNENYARELLELHTMGVDGGYTEEDVREIARVFTGWRTTGFDPRLHDDGDKVVLGQTIPGGGQEEGEMVLDILAEHPSTASHICTKLVERFVSDTPDAAMVDGCASVFLASGGDIRTILRHLFLHPDFAADENFRSKMKTPLEFVVGAVRALGLPLRHPEGDPISPLEVAMRNGLEAMGMELFRYPVPTGFPERGVDWISSAQSLARIQFLVTVVFSADFEVRDWLIEQDMTSPSEIVDFVSALTLNGRYGSEVEGLLFDVLEEEGAMWLDVYDPLAEQTLADFIATVMSLPRYHLQ